MPFLSSIDCCPVCAILLTGEWAVTQGPSSPPPPGLAYSLPRPVSAHILPAQPASHTATAWPAASSDTAQAAAQLPTSEYEKEGERVSLPMPSQLRSWPH